jgi:hypothetical protein
VQPLAKALLIPLALLHRVEKGELSNGILRTVPLPSLLVRRGKRSSRAESDLAFRREGKGSEWANLFRKLLTYQHGSPLGVGF